MKLAHLCLAAALLIPVAARAEDSIDTQMPVQSTMVDPQDRTISWYMQHTDARKSRIAVCDNDPGHLENDPDCINAKKADNQAGVDDFKHGVDNTVQGAADFFHKF